MNDTGDVFLIEVNSNPCLELSSNLLRGLIPKMIDDALALTVDKTFPIESYEPIKSSFGEENLWEFIIQGF